jgi:hypothetical protein
MIREVQPGEGAFVAEVLHELRPHRRVDEIPTLIDAQRAEGYRGVASSSTGTCSGPRPRTTSTGAANGWR